MDFQLANISGSLERAAEASLEAIRKLEYCHAQAKAARTVWNEPLPEVVGASEAIQRIEHKILSRFETVTDQLKFVQMNFMMDVQLERVTQSYQSVIYHHFRATLTTMEIQFVVRHQMECGVRARW